MNLSSPQENNRPVDVVGSAQRGRGRPTSVSADAVARTGLELFLENGFDATTMTDIARAAGIGRKTLFTYFPNKADIVWSRFTSQLKDLSEALEAAPLKQPTTEAIVAAVLRGLHMDLDELPSMRAEVTLIAEVPHLKTYAFAQGAPWRATITQFIAQREGLDAEDVLPEVLGHGYWHAMFVGFRKWIQSGEQSPVAAVTAALQEYSRALDAAFAQESHREAK